MRLLLKLDAPWTPLATEDRDGTTYRHDRLDVQLRATPLADARTVDAPATTATMTVSALGWPVHVIDRAAAPGRALCELAVRYTCLEYAAWVVVSGPSEVLATHRDELLRAALAARPEWATAVACLGDLFADVR